MSATAYTPIGTSEAVTGSDAGTGTPEGSLSAALRPALW
jgi:hypothetical protein